MMKGAAPYKVIDDYLADVGAREREVLQKIRETILTVAPKAEEVISYQIPSFRYQGMLVGFGTAKNHLSFYVMSPAVMSQFKEELKKYDTSTATIRFPLEKPIPASLIKKIVRARVAENEAHQLAKKMKKKPR